MVFEDHSRWRYNMHEMVHGGAGKSDRGGSSMLREMAPISSSPGRERVLLSSLAAVTTA